MARSNTVDQHMFAHFVMRQQIFDAANHLIVTKMILVSVKLRRNIETKTDMRTQVSLCACPIMKVRSSVN